MTDTPTIPDVIAGHRRPRNVGDLTRVELADRAGYASTRLAARCHRDVLYRLAGESPSGSLTLPQLIDLVLPLLPAVITEASLRGEEE